MPRPNIFELATKELSQDAFIAWLIKWSAPEMQGEDQALHETGRRFVASLFAKAGKSDAGTVPRLQEVRMQFKSIDVLALFHDGWSILIEDKTNTSDHSNQLERYAELLDGNEFKEYPTEKRAKIYFKTGDQSSFDSVVESRYSIYERQDFLELLGFGLKVGVQSEIYSDFHRYLQAKEDRVASYATTTVGLASPNGWSGEQWTGFYRELKKRIGKGNWEYVANPSGGFMGFHWEWPAAAVKSVRPYLQIEERSLCFKIETSGESDKESRSASWQYWSKTILELSASNKYSTVRPSRMRVGQWMTVALFDGVFPARDEYDRLDWSGTLEILKWVEGILAQARDAAVR